MIFKLKSTWTTGFWQYPIYGVFLISMSLCVLSGVPLKAMTEEVKDACQPNVLKRVTTKERLELTQKILRSNPSLTLWDKISKELWPVYERDKAFILTQSQKRKNGIWIAQKVEELDAFIKGKGFADEMSFADYTFIGYTWANILTAARIREQTAPEDLCPEDYNNLKIYEVMYDQRNIFYRFALENTKCSDSIEGCFLKFNRAAQHIQKMGYVSSDMDINLMFLGTSGIVLPHISMTGVVPLLSFNEGWGFFTTKDEDQASYVDFLAVGTNYNLEWDSTKDAPCLSSWGHDIAHMGRSSRFKGKENSHQLQEVFKIASLRKALAADELSEEERKKAELAFYVIFRENACRSGSFIAFEDFVMGLITDIELDLTNGTLKSIGVFPQEAQADFNVRAAKSLGIVLEGSDNLEKQRPYLMALKEGYQILYKHRHAIDSRMQ